MRLYHVLFCAFLMAMSSQALAKLKVVTTTTDLAWAAEQIGGELVEVSPLLDGTENAHYVDAVPDFILQAANADVVCIVGLDLEIGWINKVLAKSGNANVQPGGAGYCEAGKKIDALEKPQGKVDRSMGDVHPAGNPHFWLSPEAFAQGAEAIADTLISVDSGNAATYLAGYEKFKKRMSALQAELKATLDAKLAKKGPISVIQYHTDFSYFLNAYGIEQAGSIEEKPGVAPSAGRIARVALDSKKSGVKLAMALSVNPTNTLQKFSELSGVKVVQLPGSVQPAGQIKSYEDLQRHYISQIIKNLK